jgi:hypothetical protein
MTACELPIARRAMTRSIVTLARLSVLGVSRQAGRWTTAPT